MAENVKMTENNGSYYDGPCKLIFKPAIARELIRSGFKVVDLKQNREHPERTIIVFADSIEFRDGLQKIIKKRREHFKEMSRNKNDNEEPNEGLQQED